MIITIGGLAGTGTTTTAELLSEKLDIPYISAGFVFREMAAEKGMSVLEFSEFAEVMMILIKKLIKGKL